MDQAFPIGMKRIADSRVYYSPLLSHTSISFSYPIFLYTSPLCSTSDSFPILIRLDRRRIPS